MHYKKAENLNKIYCTCTCVGTWHISYTIARLVNLNSFICHGCKNQPVIIINCLL